MKRIIPALILVLAVVSAANGDEAVRIVQKDPDIALVLMDIDLGDGPDGTEAAARILDIRSIPVIFLTGHAEMEMVERAKSITNYGYVLKSSGEFVLMESIDMAFELFEARTRAEDEAARGEDTGYSSINLGFDCQILFS